MFRMESKLPDKPCVRFRIKPRDIEDDILADICSLNDKRDYMKRIEEDVQNGNCERLVYWLNKWKSLRQDGDILDEELIFKLHLLKLNPEVLPEDFEEINLMLQDKSLYKPKDETRISLLSEKLNMDNFFNPLKGGSISNYALMCVIRIIGKLLQDKKHAEAQVYGQILVVYLQNHKNQIVCTNIRNLLKEFISQVQFDERRFPFIQAIIDIILFN